MVHKDTFNEGTTMQYRRVGFFALCSVALVGCGAVAANHALGAQPAAVGSAGSICPSSGPTNTTGECVTPSEAAQGQTPAHMATVPDSALLSAGLRLNIGPSMDPKFSKGQCEATLEANGVSASNIHEGLLAYWQQSLDDSSAPTLVWVFNDTSATGEPIAPNGKPYSYGLTIVNATTGKVIGGFSV